MGKEDEGWGCLAVVIGIAAIWYFSTHHDGKPTEVSLPEIAASASAAQVDETGAPEQNASRQGPNSEITLLCKIDAVWHHLSTDDMSFNFQKTDEDFIIKFDEISKSVTYIAGPGVTIETGIVLEDSIIFGGIGMTFRENNGYFYTSRDAGSINRVTGKIEYANVPIERKNFEKWKASDRLFPSTYKGACSKVEKAF